MANLFRPFAMYIESIFKIKKKYYLTKILSFPYSFSDVSIVQDHEQYEQNNRTMLLHR